MSGLTAAPFWSTLTEWLPPNDAIDRPQIQIATVDETGAPDIRTVLLTSFDDEGFAFNTDAASRKVAHLAADPRIAIVILWPGFTWQLTIQGAASPATHEQWAAAYAKRSPYLKQLAWQNSLEFAQLPHEERVARWTAFAAEHDLDEIGPSPTWAGFIVRPTRLTFWRSDPDTASQRTEYRLVDGVWERHLLAG
ncbi:pyridoxamine 5'-phosphate oxidase family protein [Galbitalea sp. SE-J8]|uniref:pyridoxamine 5'-phosphate oxidase family protein n=1 Tax=Galbitalea sp. SE-J8 TaxID=3054952 RepID=UPI00259CD415|nr:pyridoxamine 5'-phosphate oxidase family protein [Galbitalea sp. SE-J8]MDM4762120.1 pyridoxamine 5'-phosphate oxidase family protein [Galbitalea sp. SE-J8]